MSLRCRDLMNAVEPKVELVAGKVKLGVKGEQGLKIIWSPRELETLWVPGGEVGDKGIRNFSTDLVSVKNGVENLVFVFKRFKGNIWRQAAGAWDRKVVCREVANDVGGGFGVLF